MTLRHSARAPRPWSNRSARFRPSRTGWGVCSSRPNIAAPPIASRVGVRRPGLEVSEDALGTVRGRYRAAGENAGQNGAKRLLIGSHIDTVIDAGMYDGPF